MANRIATERDIRVLHCLSDLYVGGAANLLLQNLKLLPRFNVTSFVCSLGQNETMEGAFRQVGLQPIKLGHSGATSGPVTLSRLVRLQRELGIDLIHTNHFLDRAYAGLAAKICGTPLVTTLHASPSPERLNPNSLSSLRRSAWRSTIYLQNRFWTAAFVAVSPVVADAATRFERVPCRKICIIRSGIDSREVKKRQLSEEARSKKLAEAGVHSQGPVLLSVGRLIPEKNHSSLIRSLPLIADRFPSVRLLLAGDGQERQALEALARQMSVADYISFLGFRNDVLELLYTSDLFLFPSVSEGHPIALLEAMAAGKPIVASRIDAIKDILDGGEAGHLVDPTDSRAIADAVLHLLLKPQLARRLGRRAQQMVAERFDAVNAAARLADLYRTLLHCRSVAP